MLGIHKIKLSKYCVVTIILVLLFQQQCSGLEKNGESSVGTSSHASKVIPQIPRNGNFGHVEGRSVETVLHTFDPLGMLKSASQMVRKGVRAFRESLHEGVRVAHMFKDDVNEGVTHIWGQNTKDTATSTLQQQPEPENADAATEQIIEDSYEKLTEDSAPEADGESTDHTTARGGMFGGILRFMNVDSSRLGVIALNILIFFAEMITSSLLGKDTNSIPETRALKEGVMEWVVTGTSPILQRYLKDATSETLPENLIETLQDRTGNNTACVQLLVCKMSPIIWGVQKAVERSLTSTNNNSSTEDPAGVKETPRSLWSSDTLNHLMASFPSKDSFVKFGDSCERRFPRCQLLKFKRS